MSGPKNPETNTAKPAPAAKTPPAEGQVPKANKAKPKPGLVSEAPYSPLLIK
ncbi:hypothetical protein E9232_005413 [Inquilinus ginsengisoli]|uniref:Uncharacterized protein n=1 Tax=Inquilinus ginsengisoli TaxID=363840 RepID=A0ABU1JX53_9PROT|nr:hypothetical protein [Inquilinus ginsengisoli]MDR6292868.1 hypothetical protein [Inquilinus ginsengisoli]